MQIIEDIPHILAVADRHISQKDWSLVDVATVIFSGAACVQAFVRWLLWIGRRRAPASDADRAERVDLGTESRNRSPLLGDRPSNANRLASAGLRDGLLSGEE